MFTKSWASAIRRAGSTLLVALPMLASVASVSAQETPATPTSSPLSAEEAVAAATGEDGVLRFEVSEDMTRFVFDPDLTYEDGMPAYGATFITMAYIYPAGTLTESNGVNPDGSPEFPDKVLGEWICRGWYVGEGARTTSGAMVVSTQLINFGNEPGQATLISEGYELADVGVEFERAITGGTGPFAGAGGVLRQTLLGLNATEGVNLRYELGLATEGA